MSPLEKVHSRLVADANGCLLWQGVVVNRARPYGRVTINGRKLLVHRYVYEERHGAIPTGMVIDHLCRNPRCANVDHLEAVAQRTNVLRGNAPAAHLARRKFCSKCHTIELMVAIKPGKGRRCVRCHPFGEKMLRRLAAAALGVATLLVVTFAHAGHLAPGCDNQSLRPRLVGCCPRFLSGETLPPQCIRWAASGHLAQCCGGPTPVATPTPEPTCPEGWTCWPTPYPTSTYAIVTDKASCCAQVRTLYTEARYEIVRRKRDDLAELMAWRKEAMRQCRETYAR